MDKKWVLRDIESVCESYGRSDSRCCNYVELATYFEESTLETKVVKKEWCGSKWSSDSPDWVRYGEFKNKTIW